MKVAYIKKPKRKGVSLWVYVLLIITASVVLSFTGSPEKEYTIKATLPKIVKNDKWLNIAKQALSKSDLPSRDVTMIIDSLTEFQNIIVQQVNSQLEADKKLEKPTSKTDSTSKKAN